MSFSCNGSGTKDAVKRALRMGTPDSAMVRAFDALAMAFGDGKTFAATVSGHVNPDGSGNVSLSVQASSVVAQAPTLGAGGTRPVESVKTMAPAKSVEEKAG